MFAMRLALQMRRVDWRKMLRELSPREFVEWIAFDRLEPIGPWQTASMVASVNANEQRIVAVAQGGQKLSPDDLYPSNAFVPGVGEKLKEKETKEMIAALDGLIGL